MKNKVVFVTRSKKGYLFEKIWYYQSIWAYMIDRKYNMYGRHNLNTTDLHCEAK